MSPKPLSRRPTQQSQQENSRPPTKPQSNYLGLKGLRSCFPQYCFPDPEGCWNDYLVIIPKTLKLVTFVETREEKQETMTGDKAGCFHFRDLHGTSSRGLHLSSWLFSEPGVWGKVCTGSGTGWVTAQIHLLTSLGYASCISERLFSWKEGWQVLNGCQFNPLKDGQGAARVWPASVMPLI